MLWGAPSFLNQLITINDGKSVLAVRCIRSRSRDAISNFRAVRHIGLSAFGDTVSQVQTAAVSSRC